MTVRDYMPSVRNKTYPSKALWSDFLLLTKPNLFLLLVVQSIRDWVFNTGIRENTIDSISNILSLTLMLALQSKMYWDNLRCPHSLQLLHFIKGEVNPPVPPMWNINMTLVAMLQKSFKRRLLGIVLNCCNHEIWDTKEDIYGSSLCYIYRSQKGKKGEKQKNELHTYKKQWKMVNIHISKRAYRNIPSRKWMKARP